MGALLPRAHQRSRYVRFGALGEFDIEVVRRAVCRDVLLRVTLVCRMDRWLSRKEFNLATYQTFTSYNLLAVLYRDRKISRAIGMLGGVPVRSINAMRAEDTAKAT